MEFEDEIGRARSRKGICRRVEGRKASGEGAGVQATELERERALRTKLAG